MAVTTTSVAVKDANNASQSLTTLTNPAGDQRYSVSLDTPGVASYRFSANFTPQPTAAVTVISITGSATKTVRVKRIMIGGVSTANAQTIFAIQRTSALGAGGTTVSPTSAKMDSGTVASATAVVSHYTATLKAAGTAVGGPLSTFNLFTSVVTTPTLVPLMTPAFPEVGGMGGSALVLRGTSDFLEIQSTNAGNLSAGTVLYYCIELEEDAS